MLTLVVVSTLIFSCQVDDIPQQDPDYGYKNFTTYGEFIDQLTIITSIDQEASRNDALDSFWDSLIQNQEIPFVRNDSVAFLYQSQGSSVSWAGDFNSWNSNEGQGRRLGESNVFILERTFPADARLDYKVVDGDNWKLDPDNPYVQYSGFGPNSELRMPEWREAIETIERQGINKGYFTENINIYSESLGYKLQYRVYTPANYAQLTNLPVIYVTDGHEYSDQRLGAMITVLDNLIHDGDIEPVIAVFIDPRNPDNLGENRRADQYRGNIDFINFVSDDLVSTIDAKYSTDSRAERRAIMGTSYGGLNSAFFGLKRSDVFGLIAMHSPAITPEVTQEYANSDPLPIKLYVHTGVINDTEAYARPLRDALSSKGYSFTYIEVNQGHSWGNWRAYLKQPLTYLFAK